MLMNRMRRGLYPTSDKDRAEDLRLGLKKLIVAAWQGGKTIPDRVMFPLRCHLLKAPMDTADGLIQQSAHLCKGTEICDQASQLKHENDALGRVCLFLESKERSPEDDRRRKALHRVRSGERMNNSHCRSLGDAVFAILSPDGHVIVTTNVKDHEPLAGTLGKTALRP